MSLSGNAAVSSRHNDGRLRSDARGSVGRLVRATERPGVESHSPGRVHRLLVSLCILGACAILIALFSDLIQNVDYRAMIAALRHTTISATVWSICATALSFAALVGRDASALRYIGARASLSALLLASFCGTALGNAVGFGALTAAAVRYRIYGAVGIKSDDIARLLLFVFAGFALGLAGIGGLAGLIEAKPVAGLLGWPADILRVVAGGALAAAASIVGFGLLGPVRVGRFHFAAPTKGLAAAQLILTSIRLIGAAAALWLLLPPTPIGFVSFAAIFSAATALGAISHIPGGAGVFEVVVLWTLRGRASPDAVAAALLAYRGVYYVLPLVLSAALFAFFELRTAVGTRRRNDDERLVRAAARISPSVMGVMTFATGIMLLVSGATPTFGHRLATLSTHLPLWAIETSHFLGSLIGAVFLFIARGLFDRRDGAWRLAIVLAIISLGFSLAKGLAFGEAGFLTVLIALLLATRQQFYRPTSMLDQPFTIGWFAAVGVIIAAAFGVLFLAFHNVGSAARDLWWEFEFDAQAPRALRALLGASVLAIGLGLRELLRAPKGLAPLPNSEELRRAAGIVDNQNRADAMMAMMGDKTFLFSPSGLAFLMFGKRGRSWIALSDPVGPRNEWPELIRNFIVQAHAHGGRAAFYQIRPDGLPFYLDAGLTVMKLGEDARVSIKKIGLQGGAAAHLRYALRRGERDGLSFELIPPERSTPHMDALAAISAEWLDARTGDEKGFSVAAFEPGYLARQWVGLVSERDRPVAFASIMTTRQGGEASIGLMRNARSASTYTMEFLFTRLILALKELNFETLSLGAVPLSGLRSSPLASRWHRLGALIWKHGDRFYNFQGLRTFKGKFNPTWEPRYLAASGTLGPFVALADAVALIGSGFAGSKKRDGNA